MGNISQRIVRRFIAAHTKHAVAIGDPNELLREYRDLLAKYASVETNAKACQEAFAELRKLIEQGAAAETLKALRSAKLPDRGPNSPLEVAVYWSHHGFTALNGVAERLCLVILQTLSLPPKTRKAVEAAAKFWARNPRFKPKGRTIEEMRSFEVDRYLEDLNDFRKHEKLFELALREGKGHTEEGEGATRFPAGPFTVVNTGGFGTDLMKEKVSLCEKVAQKMAGIGLAKVCYGDVLISNKLQKKEGTLAFYHIPSDEMFIYAKASEGDEVVRVVCHELAHRFEHKFMDSKRNLVKKLYATINTHSFLPEDELRPSPGETITDKGTTYVVESYDALRSRVKLRIPEEPNKSATVPLALYLNIKNRGERAQNDLTFITHYAKVGGPSENFAEMVSFYAMGKLPAAQVDLLKPLLE